MIMSEIILSHISENNNFQPSTTSQMSQLVRLYCQATGLQSMSQSVLVRLIEELKSINDIQNLQKIIKRYSSLLRHQPQSLPLDELHRTYEEKLQLENQVKEYQRVIHSLKNSLKNSELDLRSTRNALDKHRDREDSLIKSIVQTDINNSQSPEVSHQIQELREFLKFRATELQLKEEEVTAQMEEQLYNIFEQLSNLKVEFHSLPSSSDISADQINLDENLVDGIHQRIKQIRNYISNSKTMNENIIHDLQQTIKILEKEKFNLDEMNKELSENLIQQHKDYQTRLSKSEGQLNQLLVSTMKNFQNIKSATSGDMIPENEQTEDSQHNIEEQQQRILDYQVQLKLMKEQLEDKAKQINHLKVQASKDDKMSKDVCKKQQEIIQYLLDSKEQINQDNILLKKYLFPSQAVEHYNPEKQNEEIDGLCKKIEEIQKQLISRDSQIIKLENKFQQHIDTFVMKIRELERVFHLDITIEQQSFEDIQAKFFTQILEHFQKQERSLAQATQYCVDTAKIMEEIKGQLEVAELRVKNIYTHKEKLSSYLQEIQSDIHLYSQQDPQLQFPDDVKIFIQVECFTKSLMSQNLQLQVAKLKLDEELQRARNYTQDLLQQFNQLRQEAHLKEEQLVELQAVNRKLNKEHNSRSNHNPLEEVNQQKMVKFSHSYSENKDDKLDQHKQKSNESSFMKEKLSENNLQEITFLTIQLCSQIEELRLFCKQPSKSEINEQIDINKMAKQASETLQMVKRKLLEEPALELQKPLLRSTYTAKNIPRLKLSPRTKQQFDQYKQNRQLVSSTNMQRSTISNKMTMILNDSDNDEVCQ